MLGSGSWDSDVDIGIIPRVFEHVFSRQSDEKSCTTVSVSYLEIYNDVIIDLLNVDAGGETCAKIRAEEHMSKILCIAR